MTPCQIKINGRAKNRLAVKRFLKYANFCVRFFDLVILPHLRKIFLSFSHVHDAAAAAKQVNPKMLSEFLTLHDAY